MNKKQPKESLNKQIYILIGIVFVIVLCLALWMFSWNSTNDDGTGIISSDNHTFSNSTDTSNSEDTSSGFPFFSWWIWALIIYLGWKFARNKL